MQHGGRKNANNNYMIPDISRSTLIRYDHSHTLWAQYEKWQWEQRAIKVQMADPTYPLTRPVFQNAVQLYGIENKMKFD